MLRVSQASQFTASMSPGAPSPAADPQAVTFSAAGSPLSVQLPSQPTQTQDVPVIQRPGAAAGTFTVLVGALRVLGRHWPTMIALMIGAFVVRDVLIYLAAQVSAVHAVLGFMLFALVPIAVMTALILMLRASRASLPRVAGAGVIPGIAADGGILRHVSSVLVPFLVIYSSYGYFAEDRSNYIFAVFEDEVHDTNWVADPNALNVAERQPFDLNPVLVGVVAAALLVRWLLGRAVRLRTRIWAGFLLAYCEVLALTLGVLVLNLLKEPVLGWIGARSAAAWATTTWQSATTAAMDVASGAAPLGAAASFVGQSLGSADAVVAVPLAWLAVGAVVFGHRVAQPAAAGMLAGRALSRWRLVPRSLRRTTITATAGTRGGIMPLVEGLSLLRRIGLRTMLLFCLAFVAVQAVPDWLWELERLLIGPQDLAEVWIGASGPLSVLNEAVGMTLLICLVAAAVDLVLSVQVSPDGAQPRVAGQLTGQLNP